MPLKHVGFASPDGPSSVSRLNWKNVLPTAAAFPAALREPTRRDGGYLSALDGLVVHDMLLMHAGGECLRLRGKDVCARVGITLPINKYQYS